MGNNIARNGGLHKSKGRNRHYFLPVHFDLGLSGIKGSIGMAETKILMLMLNVIGFPVFGFALLYVGADFKAWSLWGLALIFAIYKCVHAHLHAVKMNQENKLREMELKEKEYNLFHKKD